MIKSHKVNLVFNDGWIAVARKAAKRAGLTFAGFIRMAADRELERMGFKDLPESAQPAHRPAKVE